MTKLRILKNRYLYYDDFCFFFNLYLTCTKFIYKTILIKYDTNYILKGFLIKRKLQILEVFVLQQNCLHGY